MIDFQLAYVKGPRFKPSFGINSPLVTLDVREIYEPKSRLGDCGQDGCCGNDCIENETVIEDSLYDKYMQEEPTLLETFEYDDYIHDDDKMLLPNEILGFIFRSRKWATFDIDLLEEVSYKDGWDSLVIPDSHKTTVLALVNNHAHTSQTNKKVTSTHVSMDLVRGKGNGLIILLHGEPGVGKTSTAECVADHTKRPLFAVTCGDIGDTAESVEANLETNFQLAHKWGCVMLLDEAE